MRRRFSLLAALSLAATMAHAGVSTDSRQAPAGDLTIHGIKKSVTFDVTFNGGTPSPMGAATYDLGFHATATIKRSDFGLDKMAWSSVVGDDVRLTIEAMFQQRKA